MKSRTIKVDYLARVEGEGSLYVKIKNDKVVDAQLKIFEPPRFFEAFLRGRKFTEAPDITARICGICPIAYQTSSVTAMENACGVKVEGQLRALRRLIYMGEWIESHVLHAYMLHAPDFLGYEDAIKLAADMPDVVKRALEMKKIGNDLMTIIGGREIHPVNMRVGGFYKVPSKSELNSLVDKLKWGLDAAIETVKLVATFNFPDFEQDYEFVSLKHPDEYPLFEGRLVSNKGLDIAIDEYPNHFEEIHEERSTALHSRIKRRSNYFVGPIARYNLNFEKLTPKAQKIAKTIGLEMELHNPFKSIIVRAVETVYAFEEALKIIDQYQMPKEPFIEVTPKIATGHGISEAPRGICYHRYKIDQDGFIQDAKIVPPTSQNMATIEKDVIEFVKANARLSTEKLTLQCEQAVRNYDPCISCSVHFLKLKIDRE